MTTRTSLRMMMEYCSPPWMNPMSSLRGMWDIASSQVTMVLLAEGSVPGGNGWYTVTIFPAHQRLLAYDLMLMHQGATLWCAPPQFDDLNGDGCLVRGPVSSPSKEASSPGVFCGFFCGARGALTTC